MNRSLYFKINGGLYSRVVWQRTLASSVCKQSEVLESWTQSISLSSVPLHCTLSRSIGPVPFPKKASDTAVASVDEGTGKKGKKCKQ